MPQGQRKFEPLDAFHRVWVKNNLRDIEIYKSKWNKFEKEFIPSVTAQFERTQSLSKTQLITIQRIHARLVP